MKQDYSNSMKMYDFVIKLNPYYYQACINKGKLLNTLKRYEEAHQMFDKAFELNPQDYQLYLNRGNSYFQIGEYERAVQLYDNAIKLNPQNADMYLKKGDSFIALGKMDIALELFNYAIQFKPNKQEYILRGNQYYEQKKYWEAIKFYDLLIKIDLAEGQLKKGQSLIALGNKFLEEKKYEDAIKIFDQLIQINHKEGYLKKGDILVILKRNEEAFLLFNEVIQYKPNDCEFIDRGDKYLKQKNAKEALKYYDLLIKLNPLVGYFKKGDVLIDLGRNEEAFQMFNETINYNKDQEEYISRGLKFVQQQKHKEALQFYDLLIKLNPKTGYLKKGDTLLTLGRTQEAFGMFNQSIYYKADKYDYIQRGDIYLNQQKYNYAFKFYYLALILVEYGEKSCFFHNFLLTRKIEDQEKYFQELKYEDAEIYYDVMIQLNPKEGYFKKGDELMQLGRVKEAFKVFSEAIKYNKDCDQYIKRGDKCLQEQKYGEAFQFYDLLIELSPKTGYIKKGDILLSLGKFEEGFLAFEEALKYNPDYIQYLIRGDKYFQQKDYEDAIKFYDLLIKSNPKVGYIKKGDILFAFGKIEEAFKLFEEAIKYNPHKNDYISRGDKYFKEKKFEEALQFYDLLIKFTPLEGYFKKSDALLSLGRIEEAFEMFNKSLKHNANPNEFINRGDKYFEEKQYDLAIKFYDMLVILNPSKGYLKRGDTLLAQEKFEKAFQSYSEAVQNSPNKQEYINRGDKCLKEKKYEDAFKFYDLLAIIDKKMGYLKKGETLIALGKTEEAIQMFNEVIQQEYDENEYEYPMRVSFADMLYASGNINDAIRFYKRGGSFQPHSNLKYMLLLNRRFKEADILNCKKYFFDYSNPWENHQGLYHILFEALISYEQGIYNNSNRKNNVGQQLIKYK